MDQITKMFDDIADPDDTTVATMEGICKLCEHINIDPMEDIRILILLHKLGANAKPAQISREEWMSGCESLQLDSTDKIQQLLPSLDPGFMEQMEFREMYKFCFNFNREGTRKTLDKDIVMPLVQMTLKDRIPSDRLCTFQSFLSSTKDASYDRITLDQWLSFLDFSLECHDLSEYDEETSAWPVLIDDYVDFSVSMKDD